MISNINIPLKTDVLGKKNAAHLLRRSTFKVTSKRIKQFSNYTPQQAVNKLFKNRPLNRDLPLDMYQVEWMTLPEGELPIGSNNHRRRATSYWWIDEARRDVTIKSKLTLFLHNNFMIYRSAGVEDALVYYFKMIHYYAYRSYRDLANMMTNSNIMLVYLNGSVSHKSEPNENYAREFLELFTIGKGEQNLIDPSDYEHYTEHDIQQAAKILTGMRIDKTGTNTDPKSGQEICKILANPHNQETKTFSEKFDFKSIPGGTTQEEIRDEIKSFVNMVFDQDRTAINICEKLYRFFVRKEIDSDTQTNIIEPMAQKLKDSDYKIKEALKLLLQSKHFYDEDDANANDEIVGGLIKSPLDLALQTFNYFNLHIPDNKDYLAAVAEQQADPNFTELNEDLLPEKDAYQFYHHDFHLGYLTFSGFPLHQPDSVAGYDGYFQEPGYDLNWVNTTSIRGRYTLADMLIQGRFIYTNRKLKNKVKLDIVDGILYSVKNHNTIQNSDAFINILLTDLIPNGDNISEDRKKFFHYGSFLGIQDYNSVDQSVIETAKISWKFSWIAFKKARNKYNATLKPNHTFTPEEVELRKETFNTTKAEVQIPLRNIFKAIFQSPEFQCN